MSHIRKWSCQWHSVDLEGTLHHRTVLRVSLFDMHDVFTTWHIGSMHSSLVLDRVPFNIPCPYSCRYYSHPLWLVDPTRGGQCTVAAAYSTSHYRVRTCIHTCNGTLMECKQYYVHRLVSLHHMQRLARRALTSSQLWLPSVLLWSL